MLTRYRRPKAAVLGSCKISKNCVHPPLSAYYRLVVLLVSESEQHQPPERRDTTVALESSIALPRPSGAFLSNNGRVSWRNSFGIVQRADILVLLLWLMRCTDTAAGVPLKVSQRHSGFLKKSAACMYKGTKQRLQERHSRKLQRRRRAPHWLSEDIVGGGGNSHSNGRRRHRRGG